MASSSSPTKRAQLPDPALPAPPLEDDDTGFTAQQLIDRQHLLEQHAKEAVPFSFAKGGCTYERGYVRQPVFACRTCGGGGVCAGCSIGCHAEHDLVELFAKRNFRCDCGTLSICRDGIAKESDVKPCFLRSKNLSFAPQNDENRYDKNFKGIFCRCERGKRYDAETEEEVMLQCLCCEDWFHESCTSLRPSKAIFDFAAADRKLADGPLVDHGSFDQFICNECVQLPQNVVLRRYLGANGWIVCLPKLEHNYLPEVIDSIKAVDVMAEGTDWSHAWKVYGMSSADISLDAPVNSVPNGEDHVGDAGAKRKIDAETEAVSDAKRLRTDNGVIDSFSDAGVDADEPLISVEPDMFANSEDICTEPSLPPLFTKQEEMPRLDVFLSDGFRERICRCEQCLPKWQHLPFVLDVEETYSPPRSEASDIDGNSEAGASQTSSSYDLGLAALNKLPREKMLESLQAYNKMRDALFEHLRPFAEQKKVVDAETVREFFRQQREEHDRSSRN